MRAPSALLTVGASMRSPSHGRRSLAVLSVGIVPSSQAWDLLSFAWIQEIQYVTSLSWITAQCSPWSSLQLLVGIHAALLLPSLFSLAHHHESLWRIVAVATLALCAVYTSDLIDDDILCTPTRGAITGNQCKSQAKEGQSHDVHGPRSERSR
jgi:hypothetical protein